MKKMIMLSIILVIVTVSLVVVLVRDARNKKYTCALGTCAESPHGEFTSMTACTNFCHTAPNPMPPVGPVGPGLPNKNMTWDSLDGKAFYNTMLNDIPKTFPTDVGKCLLDTMASNRTPYQLLNMDRSLVDNIITECTNNPTSDPGPPFKDNMRRRR